jgi:hypothetical protein
MTTITAQLACSSMHTLVAFDRTDSSCTSDTHAIANKNFIFGPIYSSSSILPIHPVSTSSACQTTKPPSEVTPASQFLWMVISVTEVLCAETPRSWSRVRLPLEQEITWTQPSQKQMRQRLTYWREEEEEWVGEPRNVARHKTRTHRLRNTFMNLGNMACQRVLEDSLTGGEEEGGARL